MIKRLIFLVFISCLAAREPDYLLVSNEPEKITRPGKLFEYQLKPSEAARLVYFHQNGVSENLRLHVQLRNNSSSTVSINYLAGFGGPHQDGIYAGHLATRRYLEKYSTSLNVLILQSGERRDLAIQILKYGDVGSGVVYLEAFAPLEVKVYAETITSDIAEHVLANKEANEGRIGGVFVSPILMVDQAYKLSAELNPYFRIGDEPFISDVLTNRHLQGNYGLTYHYKLKFENDTEQTKKIVFYFAPNGGPARGVFLIDGTLCETALLVPNRSEAVKALRSYSLKPGEVRLVEVMTMPQPGSNYPVTLLMRAY